MTDPEGNVKIKSGLKIVEELKSKLKDTDDIIGLKLIDLDTLICQNDCSGHGYCRQDTRSCACESFWIENFIRRNLMDGKSNCGKILDFRESYIIVSRVMSRRHQNTSDCKFGQKHIVYNTDSEQFSFTPIYPIRNI